MKPNLELFIKALITGFGYKLGAEVGLSRNFTENFNSGLSLRHDTVDIDSSLLIDDLPIDAYLDRGFGAWLDQGNP